MSLIDAIITIAAGIAGLLMGLYVIVQKKNDEKEILAKAQKISAESEQENKLIITRARERVEQQKKQFEIEQQEFMAQLDRMEKMASIKTGSLQRKETKNAELLRGFKAEESTVNTLRLQIGDLEKQTEDKLISITGFSLDKAKDELLRHYDETFRVNAEERMQKVAEWALERSVKDAQNLLAETIFKFTGPTSVEHGYGNVIVPRDEIKGRIVGRGGGNIAYFEELFGVDVIFNDEPNTIIVSCFNLVQREIARFAIERLMKEKIINDEVINRVKPLAEQDMHKLLHKEGEKALKIVGVSNMPQEFIELVGKLRFRTSYGQNIMAHCFEVGYLAKVMASELGADPRISFLAGFLHDIGKTIDQEVGGSHDILTKEILEKYNFAPEIVHAAWTHHDAAPQETLEARIIQAADALSASRPGARAESLERYLEKIKDLQDTALSFEGVKKAFAINAGREVRVVVEPEKIDDDGVNILASNIAAKVQEKGGYPGKVKVTTIRITKVTDYAK